MTKKPNPLQCHETNIDPLTAALSLIGELIRLQRHHCNSLKKANEAIAKSRKTCYREDEGRKTP